MEIKEFNEIRSKNFSDDLTKIKSRLIISIGVSEQNMLSCMFPSEMSQQQLAGTLESIAHRLRKNIASLN